MALKISKIEFDFPPAKAGGKSGGWVWYLAKNGLKPIFSQNINKND